MSLSGVPLQHLIKPTDEQEYHFHITDMGSIYAKSEEDAIKRIKEKYIPSLRPEDFIVEIVEVNEIE